MSILLVPLGFFNDLATVRPSLFRRAQRNLKPSSVILSRIRSAGGRSSDQALVDGELCVCALIFAAIAGTMSRPH